MEEWVKDEVNDDGFADARLAKRLKALMGDMSRGLGNPIPLACQDWAATKGAYRFLSNDRVDESCILEGHFQATARRFESTRGFCFVLHDTTDFSYHRSNPEKTLSKNSTGMPFGGTLKRTSRSSNRDAKRKNRSCEPLRA
ncbi:MAG: IS4/Tn5 family transposase DNA-binding protein [Planctomycetota bacterium]|jgi:hypothetical protein